METLLALVENEHQIYSQIVHSKLDDNDWNLAKLRG